ncbi:MAG: vanadium-dependent haloperoxidase, partial [Usitatibacteraceae bacterium]
GSDEYRPHTTAGNYVPTVNPVSPGIGLRKPWLMSTPKQFRPGPPPALSSETWARDFNEVKALGGAKNSQRTQGQTDIARFWEATSPAFYWPIVRSVVSAPGHDATHNARLFAAAAVAMDDAMIAIFDAKYTYNFWRPVTAIRNGDIDGNDATTRDASWTPFIDTPMHPEYPCAHCIVSGCIGAVLEADIGAAPMPPLSTKSPTAAGATRTWTRVSDLVMEVQNARVYDGVHFRNSAQVGAAMGRQIGQLAAKEFFR